MAQFLCIGTYRFRNGTAAKQPCQLFHALRIQKPVNGCNRFIVLHRFFNHKMHICHCSNLRQMCDGNNLSFLQPAVPFCH